MLPPPPLPPQHPSPPSSRRCHRLSSHPSPSLLLAAESTRGCSCAPFVSISMRQPCACVRVQRGCEVMHAAKRAKASCGRPAALLPEMVPESSVLCPPAAQSSPFSWPMVRGLLLSWGPHGRAGRTSGRASGEAGRVSEPRHVRPRRISVERLSGRCAFNAAVWGQCTGRAKSCRHWRERCGECVRLQRR